MLDSIRLSGIIKESIVDGPGLRFVVFTQGCQKKCPGCHNEKTWKLDGGKLYNLEQLAENLKSNNLIQGLTISGGEPTLQAEACLFLAKKAKELGLNILLYSGFYYEELLKSGDSNVLALLDTCDYLMDGPYIEALRDLTLTFKGSSNQRMIDLATSKKKRKTIVIG